MKAQGKTTIGRRQFLRNLGVGAGAAVAAPIASAKADDEGNAEKRKSRYRLTDHIKEYYRVNRYPAKA